ncbi:MAG TPA: MFS transporter [Solirubrobacterales bacterium]|jgi:EmrB/QacA subfamily drug resistance transporter|nr:MFS transporter [Solirubrobacterales bacterium]
MPPTPATTSGPAEPTRARDRRWAALAVVSATELMIALDLTVMLIALPSAQHDLGMTIREGRWVIIGYTLAFGALLMLGGRVADRIGRRQALIVGSLGFAAASALGGAAVGPGMLLAARALQGMFAALLAPSTVALISVTFHDHAERAKAFGRFGATVMVGIALGLLLGGALTQFLDWRWCLLINVPIAAGCAIGAWRFVPATRAATGLRLDLPGGVLVGTGVGALVFATATAEIDGWGSPLVVGLIVAAIVLLALFALCESRESHPLLPLRILGDRQRLGADLAFLAANVANNGAFLLLTYQAQRILGYGALLTGVAFLPLVLVIAPVSTQVTPRLLSRHSRRALITAGLLAMTIAMLAMTRLSAGGSYLELLVPLAFIGLGMGLSSGPASSAGAQVEDPADASAASSVVRASQQIGAALGAAIMTTIAAGFAAASRADEPPAAAVAHGFAEAGYWSAGILVATAIAVWWIMPRPTTTEASGADLF